MAKEFKIPQLGENVESATVARILVSEGDTVEEEQPVVELETEKAATELPCDISGIVEKIHVNEGDEVEVGMVLLTLKEEEEDNGQARQEEAGKDKKKAEEQQKEEEEEEEGEEETDGKEAAQSGKGDSGGEVAGKEEEHEEKEGEAGEMKEGEPEPESRDDEKQSVSRESAPAAPSVRRFAREIGVDIDAVHGSGPNNRISLEDVKLHARSSAPAGGGAPAHAELPDFSQWGDTERKPMGKVRRLTAENMSRSWSMAPRATQFGKADVAEVEKLRQRFKEETGEAGGRLTLTVILVKAVACALKAFPGFNASVDWESNEIVYKHYCHIGIAMDTERGLVVPVIRDADRQNVIELAIAMKDLTDRARAGKLKAEEMRGGSMTITNAGALGGDIFVPIVNWPEVAILGIARTRVEPVFQDGQFQPRTMLPLALSYDHRIIDGADGVRFMERLVELIEEPAKILMKG